MRRGPAERYGALVEERTVELLRRFGLARPRSERDSRIKRVGESRYLVEPNVKEGKGGLRDLQTLYWIGKYLYRVYDAADLVQHNVFTREEYKTFQKAEAFLWNVRVHLHYLLARAEEPAVRRDPRVEDAGRLQGRREKQSRQPLAARRDEIAGARREFL